MGKSGKKEGLLKRLKSIEGEKDDQLKPKVQEGKKFN